MGASSALPLALRESPLETRVHILGLTCEGRLIRLDACLVQFLCSPAGLDLGWDSILTSNRQGLRFLFVMAVAQPGV